MRIAVVLLSLALAVAVPSGASDTVPCNWTETGYGTTWLGGPVRDIVYGVPDECRGSPFWFTSGSSADYYIVCFDGDSCLATPNLEYGDIVPEDAVRMTVRPMAAPGLDFTFRALDAPLGNTAPPSTLWMMGSSTVNQVDSLVGERPMLGSEGPTPGTQVAGGVFGPRHQAIHSHWTWQPPGGFNFEEKVSVTFWEVSNDPAAMLEYAVALLVDGRLIAEVRTGPPPSGDTLNWTRGDCERQPCQWTADLGIHHLAGHELTVYLRSPVMAPPFAHVAFLTGSDYPTRVTFGE